MAQPFYKPIELLVYLESSGILHRMVRRHAPGYSDDGLVMEFPYRACEGRLDEHEECLGCTARRLIEEEG
jgi:hypothetical protein